MEYLSIKYGILWTIYIYYMIINMEYLSINMEYGGISIYKYGILMGILWKFMGIY